MTNLKWKFQKIMPFTITSKRIKYLGINLATVVKKICTLKAAKLLGKNQRRLKKWKDIPCSWAGRQCY